MREALLSRSGLPPAVRSDLVSATAAALSAFVVGCDWLSPERADRAVREACDKAHVMIAADAERDSDWRAARQLVAHLRACGRLTPSLVLRALLSGNSCLFEASLVELSGLSERKVLPLARDGRGTGFAAIYGAAGLPPKLLPAFRAALAARRECGAALVGSARLSREMIERVLTACEGERPGRTRLAAGAAASVRRRSGARRSARGRRHTCLRRKRAGRSSWRSAIPGSARAAHHPDRSRGDRGGTRGVISQGRAGPTRLAGGRTAPLDSVVVVAVLAAALMHASWNALIRIEGDRFSSILLLSATQSAISILLFPFFPAPAAAAWPWLVASSALHVGYKLFLTKAYSHGDLAQVYPLARGSAPLIVAVVGALFLHEEIGAAKVAAVVVAIGCGVIVMSLRGGADLGRLSPHALGYALGTACFTAAYTIVDAVGARLSQSASAYTLGMFALDGASMVAIGLVARGARVFPKQLALWRTGALAGALSLGSYWVAIWAFTQAPVALVAALRETSVLMAMLIGVFLLKEPGGRWRWGAACLIVFGVVLMRL